MTITKFNPAFLTDAELAAAFVARQHDLETLLAVVRANTAPVNQHVLVVAPRGYGKTTLALRVAAAVRADPELRSRWLPVPFAEESYLVGSPAELWLEAVRRLAAVTGHPGDQAAAEELGRDRDEDRLAARALAWLKDAATQRGVRLLLVIENLQDLLSDQLSADHAWTVRKVLLHEPWLMVLGTAVDRFDAMDQPDQAMFDLFRRVDLEPLDPADCDRVWRHVTNDPLGARRAKAIRILTGGNPRLLVILAVFAKDRHLRDVIQAFDALIDDRTDYLKDNIESIPPRLRRVFLALAELWRPALARTTADRARMDVNETSAALSRLQAQGRVVVVRTQGKNHYYQLAERLYNLYVLLRMRGASQDRVRAVLDFLRYLYRPEEQREIVNTIAADACGREPHARAEHLSIVAHFLTAPRGIDELLRTLPKEVLEAPDLPSKARRRMKTAKALLGLLDREDGATWLPAARDTLTAVTKQRRRVTETHRELARRVARHDIADVDALLAAWPILVGVAPADAEHAARRVFGMKENDRNAFTLSATLMLHGKATEAVGLLDDALMRLPEANLCRRILPQVLVESGTPENLERAVNLLRGRPSTNWGDLLTTCQALFQLGRVDEAAAECRVLVGLLGQRRKPEGVERTAMTVFAVALALEPHAGRALLAELTDALPTAEPAWYARALSEVHFGDPEASLRAAQAGLKAEDSARLWGVKARAYAAAAQLDEARRAAREATDRAPGDPQAWSLRLELAVLAPEEPVEAVLAAALAAVEPSFHTRHLFAGTLLSNGGPPDVALRLLREEPHRCCALMATLIALVDGSAAVVQYVRESLDQGPWHNVDGLRSLLLRLAAAGLSTEAVELADHPAAALHLEPIGVALRVRMGQTVDAPTEVHEMVPDILAEVDALAATNDVWRAPGLRSDPEAEHSSH